MKLMKAVAAGVISVAGLAGLASPAFAAQPAAAAAVKTDKCAVHVNIAHPVARQYETLTVTSTAPATKVQVHIYYKTVSHTWNFTTPASTKTTYEFNVGHPTVNYTVKITGKVTGAPRGYAAGATCSTSFVPR